MKLLLDTHILIWFALNRAGLTQWERAVLADDTTSLFVSAISLWEIRAKNRAERRHNKPRLTLDPSSAVAFCERFNVTVEPLTIEDCLSPPPAVDPEHGDMFDEMLLVHADRLGAKLLTRDRKLRDHPSVLKSDR